MGLRLLRGFRFRGRELIDPAWIGMMPIVGAGGVFPLLWQNNLFNDLEYADWQWLYERTLGCVAALGLFCATGAEIVGWCWQRQTSLDCAE